VTAQRSDQDLAAITAETEAWLDAVDPSTLVWENPVDLRRIGAASVGVAAAEGELRDAVQAARQSGRSWAEIGLVLGVSRQAAQQRFS
jgi:hypothetical protein